MKNKAFRWRTRVRKFLPWFLINRGFAKKGKDCEASGSGHEWYRIDEEVLGCYHCEVKKVKKRNQLNSDGERAGG